MVLALLVALNDSSVMAVGGTVTCLDDLTSVAMVSEKINVNYAARHVDTSFVFKNTSTAPVDVTMGFPEEGYGDVQTPDGPSKSWFEAFKSWVDGQPVQVTLKRSDEDDMMYRQWWVKEVTFKGGQQRLVRNAYVTKYSSSTNMDAGLTYVLGSGRPWQGKIGSAVITFDMAGLKRGTSYFASPKPTRKTGTKLVWEYKNFEPVENMGITVRHLLPVGKDVPQPKEPFEGETKYIR